MENAFEHLIPDYVLNLQPYVAGKPIWEVQREYGLTDVIKLASNENPLGPSPKAVEAVQSALTDLHRYPDTDGADLRNALARLYKVKKGNIILGNGSEGIMSNIMRCFLSQDDEVISVVGTFVGFTVMARSRAKAPVLLPLNDYRFDLEVIADHISERTKIVYLCNPNNPTGTYFRKDEFERFLARLPKRVLVILDEAYFEYARGFADYPDSMQYRHDQVITLRTFSKVYGLAGLRIGYGFAHEYLIENLYKIKLPFEPATTAQAGGLAALRDEEFLARSVACNDEGRVYLQGELGKMGLDYRHTAANFILVVMRDEAQVTDLCEQMLRRGVIIRPLRGFGLPHCCRISIGTMPENRRCVEALRAVLGR